VSITTFANGSSMSKKSRSVDGPTRDESIAADNGRRPSSRRRQDIEKAKGVGFGRRL
jgi:hypothetical protein